jgi:hypothetical protein
MRRAAALGEHPCGKRNAVNPHKRAKPVADASAKAH